MSVPCPFCEHVSCEENGYRSDGKECIAWIQPAAITDLCSSGWCEKKMFFGKEVYLVKECEVGRCPYIGCGRIEQVERLPKDAILAVCVYQSQKNADAKRGD